MNCPHCAHFNIRSAKHCKNCGGALPEQPKASRAFYIIIGGCLLCGGCGLIGLLASLGTPKKSEPAAIVAQASPTIEAMILRATPSPTATPQPTPTPDEERQVRDAIKARGALEWPNDARMQLYVIRQQAAAYKFMRTVPDSAEKQQALREWPSDYRMQQYVYKRQVEARRAIEAMR